MPNPLVSRSGVSNPPSPGVAGPGSPIPPPTLRCDGIEVTQAIQNLPGHDVPLLAGKRTVVRVYLSGNAPAPFAVRGTLTARPLGGVRQYVTSMNAAVIDPSENGDLRAKRETLDKGLNFLLPMDLTTAGEWEFGLAFVELTDSPTALGVPAQAARMVRFERAPPLRLHIVCIRFPDPTSGAAISPRTTDLALIRSWLQRAYPVADLVWSTATMDFPFPWEFTATRVNGWLRTLRPRDVEGGTDPRTHYYGLVYEGPEGKYFMQGMASTIPGGPDPAAVASGPTGTGRFHWNTPAAYGDWYTGHELAHTLGREHANFCGAMGGTVPYPHPQGQISPDSGESVGFDTGDETTGQPMRPLRGAPPDGAPAVGELWRDLMSYCPFQWLSVFTYRGILARLRAEEALGSGSPPLSWRLLFRSPLKAISLVYNAIKTWLRSFRSSDPAIIAGARTGPAAPIGQANRGSGMIASIQVVATVNRSKHTGKIVSVVPSHSPPRAASLHGEVKCDVVLLDGDGVELKRYPAAWIPDACVDAEQDETGMIDTLVPNLPRADKVKVEVEGREIDTFQRGVRPSPVRDIHPAASGFGGRDTIDDPLISWVDDAAAKAGPGNRPPVYLVDVSTNGGRRWRTIGVNLTTPQVRLDRSLLAGAKKVLVRVTSTDGFTEETKTNQIDAAFLAEPMGVVEEWWQAHQADLTATAEQLLGNRTDAEAATWMLRTARFARETGDRVQAVPLRQAHEELLDTAIELLRQRWAERAALQGTTGAGGAAGSLAGSEELGRLATDCIAQLPEQEREAFDARYRDGETPEAVADTHGGLTLVAAERQVGQCLSEKLTRR